MQIITFSTYDADGWQPPRFGALLNSQYLLNFEGVFEGAKSPANHLAWLDMDGPWFQKSRETFDALANGSRSVAEAMDVIATGTPPGVGFARKPPVFLKHGDVMEVEIEKIGTLNSVVRNEAGKGTSDTLQFVVSP